MRQARPHGRRGVSRAAVRDQRGEVWTRRRIDGDEDAAAGQMRGGHAALTPNTTRVVNAVTASAHTNATGPGGARRNCDAECASGGQEFCGAVCVERRAVRRGNGPCEHSANVKSTHDRGTKGGTGATAPKSGPAIGAASTDTRRCPPVGLWLGAQLGELSSVEPGGLLAAGWAGCVAAVGAEDVGLD